MRRLSVIATVGVTVAALGVGLAIRPTAAAVPVPPPATLPASVRVVGVVTDQQTGGEWIGLSDGRVLTFGAPLLGQAIGPAATNLGGSSVLPIHGIVAVGGACRGFELLGRVPEQFCAPSNSLGGLDGSVSIGTWGDFGAGGSDEHLGGAVWDLLPRHGKGGWTVDWWAQCFTSSAQSHHCSRAALATWKTPPLADRQGFAGLHTQVLPQFTEHLAPGEWLIWAEIQGHDSAAMTLPVTLAVASARPNPQVTGIAFDVATGGDWIVLAGGRVLAWHAPRISPPSLRGLLGGTITTVSQWPDGCGWAGGFQVTTARSSLAWCSPPALEQPGDGPGIGVVLSKQVLGRRGEQVLSTTIAVHRGRWIIMWAARCQTTTTHRPCSRAAERSWRTPPVADRRGVATRTGVVVLPQFTEHLAPGEWWIGPGMATVTGSASSLISINPSVLGGWNPQPPD